MKREKIIGEIIAFFDDANSENTAAAALQAVIKSVPDLEIKDAAQYIDFMKQQGWLIDIAQYHEKESLWVSKAGYAFQRSSGAVKGKGVHTRRKVICGLLCYIDDTKNKIELQDVKKLFASMGAETFMPTIEGYFSYLKKENLIWENRKKANYPQNAWVSAQGYEFLQMARE